MASLDLNKSHLIGAQVVLVTQFHNKSLFCSTARSLGIAALHWHGRAYVSRRHLLHHHIFYAIIHSIRLARDRYLLHCRHILVDRFRFVALQQVQFDGELAAYHMHRRIQARLQSSLIRARPESGPGRSILKRRKF